MEEERDLVTFIEEDGNEFDLEVIDYIEYDGREFGVLIDPEAEDQEDEELTVCIMEILVKEEEDLEEFVPVEDDELQDTLFEIVQKRFAEAMESDE